KQADADLQNRLATIPLDQFERRNAEQQVYLELIGKTVIAESEAMAQARKNFEELLAAQADWRNGMQAALEDYVARAQDVASQTKDLTSGIVQGMEDLFTDFITKGKADWKGFFDSIAADFVRMAVRQQISGFLQKFLPGAQSGDQASALSGAATQL